MTEYLDSVFTSNYSEIKNAILENDLNFSGDELDDYITVFNFLNDDTSTSGKIESVLHKLNLMSSSKSSVRDNYLKLKAARERAKIEHNKNQNRLYGTTLQDDETNEWEKEDENFQVPGTEISRLINILKERSRALKRAEDENLSTSELMKIFNEYEDPSKTLIDMGVPSLYLLEISRRITDPSGQQYKNKITVDEDGEDYNEDGEDDNEDYNEEVTLELYYEKLEELRRIKKLLINKGMLEDESEYI